MLRIGCTGDSNKIRRPHLRLKTYYTRTKVTYERSFFGMKAHLTGCQIFSLSRKPLQIDSSKDTFILRQ